MSRISTTHWEEIIVCPFHIHDLTDAQDWLVSRDDIVGVFVPVRCWDGVCTRVHYFSREFSVYWSGRESVRVCKATKVFFFSFLFFNKQHFYIPLSHIQLWRVRVISGFQLCMIEPCSASGPYSFIRVLVERAVLGAEVSHAVLHIKSPIYYRHKRKQEVILFQNTT